jgi:hypothetical protein
MALIEIIGDDNLFVSGNPNIQIGDHDMLIAQSKYFMEQHGTHAYSLDIGLCE